MNRSLLIGLGVAAAGLLGFLIYWFFFHKKGGGGDNNSPGGISLVAGSGDEEGNWVISWKAPQNKGNGTDLQYKWQVLGPTGVVLAHNVVSDPTTADSFPQHNEDGTPVLLTGLGYTISIVASSSAGDSEPATLAYGTPKTGVTFLGSPIFQVTSDGTNVSSVHASSNQVDPQTAAWLQNYLSSRSATAGLGKWVTYDASNTPLGSGMFGTQTSVWNSSLVEVASTEAPWIAPPAGGSIVFTLGFYWPFCGVSPTCPSSSGKWGRPSVAPGPVTSIVFSPNA